MDGRNAHSGYAPHSVRQLIEALRSFGFRTGEGRISRAAYPCVGFLAGDEPRPALLVKRDAERLLYFVAGSQTPQTAPVGSMKETFGTEVLLVRHESAKESADEDGAPVASKFGFRWFWAEMLRQARICWFAAQAKSTRLALGSNGLEGYLKELLARDAVIRARAVAKEPV